MRESVNEFSSFYVILCYFIVLIIYTNPYSAVILYSS